MLSVALLTSPGSGSVAALLAAHRTLGHRVVQLPADAVPVVVGGGRVSAGALAGVDVVHSRLSLRALWPVQEALEQAGTVCVNRYDALVAGRDKWACHLRLAAAGIPSPATTLWAGDGDLHALLESLGGWPLVVKPLDGFGGQGVALACRAADLPAGPGLWLLQRFVADSAGSDVRVDVVDGQVVARWRRTAQADGEFRANVALGGRETVEPADPDLDAVAVAAAKACGLTLAGVDVFATGDGWQVVEVNTNAGVLSGGEPAPALDGRTVPIWHAEAVAAAAAT